MGITPAKANAGSGNYIRYDYYHENLDYLMCGWIEK